MFDYQKKVTAWEDSGTEPPEGLRKWQAGEKPPAAWWNWFWDAVGKCLEDIKDWIHGHQDSNTGVHGVGTGYIETIEGAQAKANEAISAHLATTDPHSQYANKVAMNQAFSNDPAIGHNHNGVGKGAPIPGTAIVGAVAQATSAAICTGNAATAANVTTNINGQAITNIFESDGVTVKNATVAASCSGNAATSTLAEEAKGNTRFQVSGCIPCSGDGSTSKGILSPIADGAYRTVQMVSMSSIPAGKKLVLKGVRFWFSDVGIRFIITGGGSYTYQSTGCYSIGGLEQPNTLLYPGPLVDGPYSLSIRIKNVWSSSTSIPAGGWWLDLAIEDV